MRAFFNLIFYFSKEGFFKNVRLKVNVLKVKSNIDIFFFIATFISTLLKFFDIIFKCVFLQVRIF